MTLLHHAAIRVADVEQSVRFYRDGLALTVLMDHEFEGPWRDLFDGPADRLRSVFLGDPARPEGGIVELVVFDGATVRAAPPTAAAGFFLLSFFVAVDSTLARLSELGLGGEPRRVEVPGRESPVTMATVRDPDGVLVELVGAPS